MTRDVFISYARKDIARITRLIEALSAAGVQVWWDQELNPGEVWQRVLIDRLSTTSGLIVCWTPASIASTYVLAEARIALDRALLIPALLTDCMPPPPFNDIQSANLTAWNGEPEAAPFKRLLESIDRNFAERAAYERFLAAQHRMSALLERIDLERVTTDAAGGQALAQSLLGHALVIGNERTPRDLDAGIVWLKKAAEQGMADAAATLGTAYALLVYPNDWPGAVYWLERAARAGNTEAALELANIYSIGFEGVERNAVLADRYMRLGRGA